MECPYCNSELEHYDSYGTLDYISRGVRSGKGGDIFKCPNHEEFEDEESAKAYLQETGESLESLGSESLEELSCQSSEHHVSGCFYTDRNGNLHNGYPC